MTTLGLLSPTRCVPGLGFFPMLMGGYILVPILCSPSVFSAPFCGLQAIITALGVDRRNRVLAGLYMGRSDTQLVVRQASLHVWKIVVSNTPRTLREILPTLFGLLLGFLASTCADKRTVSFLGLPLAHQPQCLLAESRELQILRDG